MRKNVFNIPLSQPFLTTLARYLLAREDLPDCGVLLLSRRRIIFDEAPVAA
jgi:hypothetical protein